MVNQVARSVEDPQTGLTVAERSRAALDVGGQLDRQTRSGRGADRKLYPLGSGSDYTPFLQHLGIASLNIGYGGEGQYGQYHSIYDSIDHFERFMDPGYAYAAALTRTAGRIVLRLANADLLPFEFEALADEVGIYVGELEELTETMREETAEVHRRLDAGHYEAAADPTETYVPPAREAEVPHLNFAPLHNASDRLDRAAGAYGKALASLQGREPSAWPSDETLAEVDRIVYRSERALTREEGLPGREWYIHHLYAPGFYTGYGDKTLPGVR
jgi:N-acetylated-alpha-linked acidic dipeptidase